MELVASSTIFTPCTFFVVYVYLEGRKVSQSQYLCTLKLCNLVFFI